MDYYKDKVFPVVRDRHAGDGEVLAAGLTKREYFAALAMQGIVAGTYAGLYGLMSNPYVAESTREAIEDPAFFKGMVSGAIDYADALISALETPSPEPQKEPAATGCNNNQKQ